MKIVIAPNALKSSLAASAAAEAIAAGIHNFNSDISIVKVPVADGGDGLVDVLLGALGGELITCKVHDPLFREITASYAYVKASNTAAIEMALASGLALVNDTEKNPMDSTTLGTGELIRDAVNRGARHIILGIGGSATNDGGMGVAAALGVRFYDKNNNELRPVGRELINISRIDTSGILPEMTDVEFDVACDVENPLTGISGAAYVYAKQKGASPEEIEFLDNALSHYAQIIQNDLKIAINDIKGAGAAGGLGGGLIAFTGARLIKGIDLIFDAVKLEEKIKDADLVFTAEGQIDFQTKFGKAPAGVGNIAKKYHIPCIALAGSIGEKVEELRDCGITSCFTICPGPVTLETALSNASSYLSSTAKEIMHTFCAGKQL